jgi:hypothetical protein
MADDEKSPRDELDGALTRSLRGLRPSLPIPQPGSEDLSDDDLLRYVDGAMSEGEREAFERRIADHPDAADRIAIVVDALADSGWPLSRPEPVGRRAVQLASRFVFRLSNGVLTFLRGTELPREFEPALAVRSPAPPDPPSFFEFISKYPQESGGDVDARLALEPAGPDKVDVELEVTQSGSPLDGVRVKLIRDGRPIDSSPTEAGKCSFSGLRLARYELEIRKAGVEVGRMVLDIRGDGIA